MAASFELSLPPMDALPYYDTELDKDGMRAKVEREVAKEMKEGNAGRVSDDRLPPAVELFKDRPDLAELLQKAGEGVPINALDRSRYQLPAPAQGKDATPEEWAASLRNAEIQLMHSETRLTNLELLKKYGGE